MSSQPGKLMTLDKTDAKVQNLIKVATAARELAYVPYSKFKVGCALLTDKGNIYTGCNVENASFGLAICAERTAITKAVSEGDRHFVSLAVVSEMTGPCQSVAPCGACRQFIHEFGVKNDILIYCYNISTNEVLEITSPELLPWGFRLIE
uniref:Cytidine deaminase n=1 Tax=Lygus hesperus TaxID=30085 RepID=A0A0A9WZT2_LYGHE